MRIRTHEKVHTSAATVVPGDDALNEVTVKPLDAMNDVIANSPRVVEPFIVVLDTNTLSVAARFRRLTNIAPVTNVALPPYPVVVLVLVINNCLVERPTALITPPMCTAPVIPTPPAQIRAPVPVVVLAVVFASVSAPSVPIAAAPA